MPAVRWGVLGTGSLARTVTGACPGAFVAAASRDRAPDGRFGLTGAQADPYRIAIAAVTAAILGEAPLEFGAPDANAQATAYEALATSVTAGGPVTKP